MTKEQLKKRVLDTIDQNADNLVALAKKLQATPEMGFQEYKTAAIIKEELEKLGLSCQDKLALTGVKARAKGKKSLVNLCIMSELDALDLPEHVKADPETGCAHACGHQSQMAMMMGAATGLIESGVFQELDGDLTFFAVPAEELVQLAWKQGLREKGIIQMSGGKGELIRLGHLDDIDLFLMEHATGGAERSGEMAMSWNGTAAKVITFKGKSAHAGKCPELGINALHAATAAMCCMNMLRESFRDEDNIRLHYIIKEGGDAVNIVPERVVMELYVRGNTFASMKEVSKAVNRAVRGAAYAMGAEVEINEMGGFMPLYPDQKLGGILSENLDAVAGKGTAIRTATHCSASTDAGDVGTLWPIAQPMFSGFTGDLHTAQFDSCDDEMAYLIPAKTIALTAVDLLWDGAKEAKEACASYTPLFQNKEEYLNAWEEFNNL